MSQKKLSDYTSVVEPWKDEDRLEDLHHGELMTITDMARELGCSPSSIQYWMDKYDIETRSDPHAHREYRDEEKLRELYVERELTIEEVADELGSDLSTIHHWLERHGIETRGRTGTGWDNPRWKPYAPTKLNSGGHVEWTDNFEKERTVVKVHRLLAVAEFGFDAVKNVQVHHENNIPWDNRPENLKLMTASEHSKFHQVARVRRKPAYSKDE